VAEMKMSGRRRCKPAHCDRCWSLVVRHWSLVMLSSVMWSLSERRDQTTNDERPTTND
jgi:hypothetical protein